MKRIMKSLAAFILAVGMWGCDGQQAQNTAELSSQIAEGAEKVQEYLDQNAAELGLDEEIVNKAKELASQAQEIFEQRAKEAGLYDFEDTLAAAKETAENAAKQEVNLNTDSSSLINYLGGDPKEILAKIVDETNLLEESNAKSYEEIYNRYEKKLKDETAKLTEEYEAEAAKNSNGAEGLKDILSGRIAKLAMIKVEGSVEMAKFMQDQGKGATEEYNEWTQKLNALYEEEAVKLSKPYQESLQKAE